MAKRSSWPVTVLCSRGLLKDLKDSKLILNESKLFPWSSRISLIPFWTFKGPLFPKAVIGQDLFFAISYSKPALIVFLSITLDKLPLCPFRHCRKCDQRGHTKTGCMLGIRYRPRFFDQVGHRTMYASMGNKHFISK